MKLPTPEAEQTNTLKQALKTEQKELKKQLKKIQTELERLEKHSSNKH